MKRKRSGVHNTHADLMSDFKSAHLYTRVDKFVCNILDMIHSSNSVLWSGGGGGVDWSVFFSGRNMWLDSLWPIWHQNKTTWFQLIEYRFHHLNKLKYQSKHYLAPPKTFEIKNWLLHNLYFLPHNWPSQCCTIPHFWPHPVRSPDIYK